ncbi:type II secretion system F family protein [Amylibacter sp. SFDW26]|uniref:type II secretion system F family protein n=1 Tax=Amylibacter sp. SFDW26 TaxID=2652722 RepID=UPI001261CFB4|nr:type II secretion system F family protein [Amylibacter sp. SFDW26]KAB7610189.1 type II secretion system F family protein [Amylibacter sp. SFDW26]
MTEFHYLAFDGAGKERKATVEASSKAEAILLIEAEGLTPIDVSEMTSHQGSIWTRDIAFFSKTISDKDQANLAELLANLFSAQLSIQDVLTIAQDSNVPKNVRVFLKQVQEKLIRGVSIGEAFNASNGVISKEFATFVSIGDASNNMSSVMMDAAHLYKKRYETSAKIKSALVYPAILLLASMALILMLIFFLVPTLSPIFVAANIPPPFLFAFVNNLQTSLSAWWHMFVVVSVSIGILLYLISQLDGPQRILRDMKYKIPIFGEIYLLSQLSSDCRFLSLLLGGGANLPLALNQVSTDRKPDVIQNMYQNVLESLREGSTFLVNIQDKEILPKEYITFIGLAERTNNWGIILKNLATVLEVKVEQKRGKLLQVMTPAITLIVGVSIGFLVYSVIDAILQINDLAFQS